MGTENRKFPRRDIDLSVQVEMADGSRVKGQLADVSQGGACLKTEKPENLPGQFMLKLSGQISRWSRVVWRTKEEVGLEFVDAPQLQPDARMKRSVMIKCPRTGRSIATGLELISTNDLGRISTARRFSQCPHCHVAHGWTPGEAFLE